MLMDISLGYGPVVVWLILLVFFVVAELATTGLVSIWFVLGALVAFIAAILGAPLWLQVVLFFVVSFVALLITRPLVKKYVNRKYQATNTDSLIGKIVTVKETVDNRAETGMGILEGKEWTLRTNDDNMVLSVGTPAKVIEIKGVKLIVEKYEEV